MIFYDVSCFCSFSQCKARVERKNSDVVGKRSPLSFHASRELDSVHTSYGESTSSALTIAKINNFSEILFTAFKTCYDNVMGMLWNAVINDTVSDYYTEWLKREHWSGCEAASVAAAEKRLKGICEVQNDNAAKPESVCSFCFLCVGLYTGLLFRQSKISLIIILGKFH